MKRRQARGLGAYSPHMRINAVTVAVAILAFNLAAALVAIALDLPAQFTTEAQPRETVSTDVLIVGSAISAPWPPLLALILGVVLAARERITRVIGLVILLLTGVVMTVGLIGEHISGIPFTGTRYAIFLTFNVVGFLLAAALMATTVRDLMLRRTGISDMS
jgi:hypothetical protein